jgi:hypothetical protein
MREENEEKGRLWVGGGGVDKGGDGKGWVRGRDSGGKETLGKEEMRGRGDDGERRMKE